MSHLPWVSSALPDLMRTVAELRTEEVTLQQRLEWVRQRIEAAERVDVALRQWADLDGAADGGDGGPVDGAAGSPPTPTAPPGSGDAQDQAPTADADAEEEPVFLDGWLEHIRSERKRKVLQLLAQSPDRWWKARQLADVLGETNIRSFRGTLNKMVETGLLERSDQVCFRIAIRHRQGFAQATAPAAPGKAAPAAGPERPATVHPMGPHRVPSQNQVLQLLAAHPDRWWRPRQVAEELGNADKEAIKAVRSHLQKLARQGVLDKNSSCRYRLPNESIKASSGRFGTPSGRRVAM